MRPRPKPITLLDELLARFFQWLEERVKVGVSKPATLVFYKGELTRWRKSLPEGDVPIDNLMPSDLTDSHRRARVVAVKCLFNFGKRQRIIDDDPFALVPRPREKNRSRIMTPEEFARLVRATPRYAERAAAAAASPRPIEPPPPLTDLIGAPYIPPKVKKGDRLYCLYRQKKAIVTSWTRAKISWPKCYAIEAPRSGKGYAIESPRSGIGLLVTAELERAIRTESAAALQHWFGIGKGTAAAWRKAFSVSTYGTPGSKRAQKRIRNHGPSDSVKAKRYGYSFRWLLIFYKNTLARPGELRSLRWRHYVEQTANDEGKFILVRQFVIDDDFKGKGRRSDGAGVRIIPVSDFIARILRIWYQRRKPEPEDFIFQPSRNPRAGWTRNALICAMRRARKAAGLNSPGREKIVMYSIRHFAATRASVNGVRDRSLSEILGHSPGSRMVARYVHLDSAHMQRQIEIATRHQRQPGEPETDSPISVYGKPPNADPPKSEPS